MNESRPTERKSPKEILRIIKKLYYEKEFERALGLCRELVQRFPNNDDLKNLYHRIEARCRAQADAPKASPPEPAETTAVNADDQPDGMSKVQADQIEPSAPAEGQVTDVGIEDVNVLIQQGVTRYDAQDFQGALAVWERAMILEPGNQVVAGYIESARAALDAGTAEADDGAQPAEEVPDKEKLLSIYNDGLQLYKDHKFDEALEKWEYILKYYPSHRETQECIEKTRAALEKEREYRDLLALAEQDLKSGEYLEAERKVIRLLIKAPNFEPAKRLKEAIEERKRQIDEIRSLELEEASVQKVTSATDDEITRYFTPETETGKKAEARKVVKVEAPKKKKKTKKVNKRLVFGILGGIAVIAVAAGGFWYYQQSRLRLDKADEPLQILITQEETWDSPEQKVEHLTDYADEYMDEGDYLFAFYAFQKANELILPRLLAVTQEAGTQPSRFQRERIENLQRIKEHIERGLAQAPTKIVGQPLDEDELEAAMKDFDEGHYSDALRPLKAALSQRIDDQELTTKLGYAVEKIAFEKIKEGDLDAAYAFFKQALVLNSSDELLWRHLRVIQLYYDGKISSIDKDQWFFFFVE